MKNRSLELKVMCNWYVQCVNSYSRINKFIHMYNVEENTIGWVFFNVMHGGYYCLVNFVTSLQK